MLLPQFGTELGGEGSREPREHGRPLQRPWSHFQFFNRGPGMLIFSQAGSHNILCGELPLQGPPGRDIFMFGQHSGVELNPSCSVLSHLATNVDRHRRIAQHALHALIKAPPQCALGVVGRGGAVF